MAEPPESTSCGGSVGVYNIGHVPEAEAWLACKTTGLRKAKLEILAMPKTDCHARLAAGARKYALPIEVVHVMGLIVRAYAMATAE